MFMRLSIGLMWIAASLTASTATAQSTARASASNGSQRLICRRMQETGSLVRTLRQCFTRAEWDRIAETARRGAERTVAELSGGDNTNN